MRGPVDNLITSNSTHGPRDASTVFSQIFGKIIAGKAASGTTLSRTLGLGTRAWIDEEASLDGKPAVAYSAAIEQMGLYGYGRGNTDDS
jgi:hypothetical protein